MPVVHSTPDIGEPHLLSMRVQLHTWLWVAPVGSQCCWFCYLFCAFFLTCFISLCACRKISVVLKKFWMASMMICQILPSSWLETLKKPARRVRSLLLKLKPGCKYLPLPYYVSSAIFIIHSSVRKCLLSDARRAAPGYCIRKYSCRLVCSS